MLTRDDLDRLLPDTPKTLALAADLSGLTAQQIEGFCDALLWLAAQTEANRFPRRPDHVKPWEPWPDTWPVSARGLEYKHSLEYLTAEGWPSGTTTCWYVVVECGWRLHVAHETPRLALIRGIIVMALAVRRNKTNKRNHPVDMISAAVDSA